MIIKAVWILMILTCLSFLTVSCEKAERISLWDRHCAACHDGKTILNGHIVINMDQMKAKYKTLDAFSNACAGPASGMCMNILKHDKKLFVKVGREIGIGGAPQRP